MGNSLFSFFVFHLGYHASGVRAPAPERGAGSFGLFVAGGKLVNVAVVLLFLVAFF